MKILFLFLLPVASSAHYDSPEALQVAVESENAYFLPANQEDVLSWNGALYDYKTRKCFHLKHSSEKVKATEGKCPRPLLDKATEPYDKISDFGAFRKKFLGCLQRQDQKCLRRLTWRNVQISFGVDGAADRRYKLFPTWKKKDFREITELLKKGISPDGESRDFPYPQSEEYVGMRGSFMKKHGGWLLVHYLGGD